MSFNFWYPFMPLYLLSVGATSQANALFWIAVATSIQGVTRLLTGPIWGVLSDRWGYSNDKLVADNNLYQDRVTTYAAWDDKFLYLALKRAGSSGGASHNCGDQRELSSSRPHAL